MERHTYDRTKASLGVLAKTSVGPDHNLSFEFTPDAANPSKVGNVKVTQVVTTGTMSISTTQMDPSFPRVKQVDALCACGEASDKVWKADDVTGGPRLQSVDRAALRVTFKVDVAPEAGASADRFGFRLPIEVTQEECSQVDSAGLCSPTGFARPPRTIRYFYEHPLLRRPTRVIEEAVLPHARRATVYDFDDDDPQHPCRQGFGARAGRKDSHNENPTRLLCHLIEQRGEPGSVFLVERVTHFVYDTRGRPVRIEGPQGTRDLAYFGDTATDVASAGRLKSSTEVGGALMLATTFDLYDAVAGQAREVRGPNGDLTQRKFDRQGRVTETVDPALAKTTTVYARGSDPDHIVLPRENVIRFGHGAFGRLESVKWESGPGGVFPAGTVLQTRVLSHNDAGDVVIEELYRGAFTAGVTTNRTERRVRAYDVAHRVTREDGLPSGVARSFAYEAGRLSLLTDEEGNFTKFVHDGFGTLREVHKFKAGAATATQGVTYGVDRFGNLTTVQDGNGNVATYRYDDFDQLFQIKSPNFTPATGFGSRFGYNTAGLLIARSDPHFAADERIEFAYDPLLRLQRVEFVKDPAGLKPHCSPANCLINPEQCDVLFCPAAVRTLLQKNTYDSAVNGKGRLASVEVPGSAKTDLAYDAAGRTASETVTLTGLATPLTTTHKYHKSGSPDEVVYPSLRTAAFDLDDTDRLGGVSFGGTRLASGVKHYPFRGLNEFTRGNGLKTEVIADSLGRIVGVSGSSPTRAANEPVTIGYSLTPRGDVFTANDTDADPALNRMRTYAHDPALGYLKSVDVRGPAGALVLVESYDYDLAGNRLKKVRQSPNWFTGSLAKQFTSVFDLKAGTTTPANDLLRQVLDPRAAPGGACVPRAETCDQIQGAMPLFERTYARATGAPVLDDAGFAATPGPGIVCATSTGVASAEVTLNGVRVVSPSQLNAHPQLVEARVGLDALNTLSARLAGRPDETLTIKVYAATGAGAPVCPPRPNLSPQRMVKEWELVLAQAKRLIDALPRLTAVEVSARTNAFFEEVREWMEKFGLEPKQLQAVLFATSANGRSFGDVLLDLLGRRETLGRTFEARDVELLRELLDLARSAEVTAAREVDPNWTFLYNAAGDVVEERATVSPFRLAGNEQVFCSTYDPLRRLTKIEYVTRQIGVARPVGDPEPPPPCQDPTRVTVAQFRYDAQNRRVYAKVQGVETFYVYGQGGELIAEVDGTGNSFREYVYLDGQPLAQVLPQNTALQRPAACTGASTAAGAPWLWLAAAALLAVAIRSRRTRPMVGLLVALWLVTCTGA